MSDLGRMYDTDRCRECGHSRPSNTTEAEFLAERWDITTRGQIGAILFDVRAACPFCGREEGMLLIPRHSLSAFSVVCPGCCIGPMRALPEAAVEAWNTRQTPNEWERGAVRMSTIRVDELIVESAGTSKWRIMDADGCPLFTITSDFYPGYVVLNAAVTGFNAGQASGKVAGRIELQAELQRLLGACDGIRKE